MADLPITTTHLQQCVHCGSNDFEKISDALNFDTGEGGFHLERCVQCGLSRTAPLLNDEDLASHYKIDYYGTASQKFFSPMERVVQWSAGRMADGIMRQLRQKPDATGDGYRILDLGCGRGTLLRMLAKRGATCTGVERAEFPSQEIVDGIEIRHGDFLQMDFSAQRFDAIVIWHVLEHLVNPDAVLNKVRSILAPGGLLLIAVPNYGGLQAQCFGNKWFHLDIPRHVYHFTLDSIKSLLSHQHFEVRKVSTWSADQSIYGFIQSTLNSFALFKQNDLYTVLKASRQGRLTLGAIAQVLLAGVITPLAIVEYFLSGLAGKGSCLMIDATGLESEPLEVDQH